MSKFHLSLADRLPTRREWLTRSGLGLGALALAGLMTESALLAPESAAGELSPLAPKKPHFPVKAKRVIHLFMNGGPSQVDTFDPKPALARYAGRPLPSPYHRETEVQTGVAFASPFRFQRYGKSGIEVSELFPRVASCIDDLAVVRSLQGDSPNHGAGLLLMNCGDVRLPRPSVGSWVLYGLGTENQNLPGFVALCPGGYPIQETENWQAAFLPGIFQGTYIDSQHTDVEKLIENVRNHSIPLKQQREQLDLLKELNQRHLEKRQQDSRLEARIQSFEQAYRMQMEATDAFDISREPKHVLDLYGPGVQGRQMLIARRLAERGVRYVQVWHGARQPWDSHSNLEGEHRKLAGECDQAIAALLKDLKQRSLLDSTLVIWGGEFGRTPTVEMPRAANNRTMTGRDHNHHGFTIWLAGGGVKGGQVYGATDEFGFAAVKDKVHIHDLHATILHLLGFDHEKLTFRYAGRDFRLTDVHGRVVKPLLA